jgi:hypothetical protein
MCLYGHYGGVSSCIADPDETQSQRRNPEKLELGYGTGTREVKLSRKTIIVGIIVHKPHFVFQVSPRKVHGI